MRTIILLLLMSTTALGQSIELIYLPTEVTKVIEYKKELTGEIGATNALSLRNISEKRIKAYTDKISSAAAAVVFGGGALKAVEKIDFPIPLFMVNGNGDTAAKSSVVVLLDDAFSGPTNDAVTVSSIGDIPPLKESKKIILKCQGIRIADVLNAMISSQ